MASRNGSVLSRPFYQYSPSALKKWSETDIRKEYARLRSVYQKRIKRLENSEFASTEFYDKYAGYFPKTRNIEDERSMRYLLSEMSRFIESPMSTIKGQREYVRKNLKTLKENGYDFINESNFQDFAEFMETVRTVAIESLYDSDRIANIFREENEKRKSGKTTQKQLIKAFKSWQAKEKKAYKEEWGVNPSLKKVKK